MSITAVKTSLLRVCQWEPNPVVVKELRQAVRSWAVTGMLMFFLVVLFVAMVLFLVSQSLDFSENTQAGAEIFGIFLVILSIASILFIPLYVGIRMAAERQENNADLLYITTLSPARIIFGKFLCGAYVILLFFSACMPFMAFTNLLRGVDLPTVFLILTFLFVAVCAANMLAIFIACLPMSRPFKILLGLGQLFLSLVLVIGTIDISFEMMRLGAGSMMGAGGLWQTAASVLGLTIILVGLLFALTVALISPPSANRALLLRLYVTIVWVLGEVLACYWAMHINSSVIVFTATNIATILLVLSLLAVISNNDQLSLRVRRKIPKQPVWRALAFLFFNGAAGGLIWVIVLLSLTLLVPYGFYSLFASKLSLPWKDYQDFIEVFPPLLIYILAYALMGLFLQRTFFPKRRPALAGVFALILVTGTTIGPSVVLFFMNELTWKSYERLQLGNPSNVSEHLNSTQITEHLCFASALLVIAILINARWFMAQVKAFRPSDKIGPSVVPQ